MFLLFRLHSLFFCSVLYFHYFMFFLLCALFRHPLHAPNASLHPPGFLLYCLTLSSPLWFHTLRSPSALSFLFFSLIYFSLVLSFRLLITLPVSPSILLPSFSPAFHFLIHFSFTHSPSFLPTLILVWFAILFTKITSTTAVNCQKLH